MKATSTRRAETARDRVRAALLDNASLGGSSVSYSRNEHHLDDPRRDERAERVVEQRAEKPFRSHQELPFHEDRGTYSDAVRSHSTSGLSTERKASDGWPFLRGAIAGSSIAFAGQTGTVEAIRRLGERPLRPTVTGHPVKIGRRHGGL